MPGDGDFDNIDSLDPTIPFDDDQVSEGTQHLRGIKQALQGNVSGDDLETRLLVNALVRFLVDATGATLQGDLLLEGAAKIDQDNSANDAITVQLLRNAIGSFSLELFDGSGTLFLRGADPDGISNIFNFGQFERGGAVSWRFDGVEQFRTADPALANTGCVTRDGLGALIPVGYNVMPTDVGGNPASFQLAPIHNGRRFRPNATITITVVTASLPADGAIVISNQGAGIVTVLGSGGPQFTLFQDQGTSIVGSFTMAQGNVVTLTRLQATNTYEVWGSGLG